MSSSYCKCDCYCACSSYISESGDDSTSEKFTRVEIWSDCGNENQKLWATYYDVTKEESQDNFIDFLDGRLFERRQQFLLLAYSSDPRNAPTTIDEFFCDG